MAEGDSVGDWAEDLSGADGCKAKVGKMLAHEVEGGLLGKGLACYSNLRFDQYRFFGHESLVGIDGLNCTTKFGSCLIIDRISIGFRISMLWPVALT